MLSLAVERMATQENTLKMLPERAKDHPKCSDKAKKAKKPHDHDLPQLVWQSRAAEKTSFWVGSSYHLHANLYSLMTRLHKPKLHTVEGSGLGPSSWSDPPVDKDTACSIKELITSTKSKMNQPSPQLRELMVVFHKDQ